MDSATLKSLFGVPVSRCNHAPPYTVIAWHKGGTLKHIQVADVDAFVRSLEAMDFQTLMERWEVKRIPLPELEISGIMGGLVGPVKITSQAAVSGTIAYGPATQSMAEEQASLLQGYGKIECAFVPASSPRKDSRIEVWALGKLAGTCGSFHEARELAKSIELDRAIEES